jgi:hypothetical protein
MVGGYNGLVAETKRSSLTRENVECMVMSSQQIAPRNKLILTGLYLSKYDSLGLRELGFESFAEAFNVIGYAMGSRPASIKNYRDEFDPLFPNRRKGGISVRFVDTASKCLRITKA